MNNLKPGYVTSLDPFLVRLAGEDEVGLPCERRAPAEIGMRGEVDTSDGGRIWVGEYDGDGVPESFREDFGELREEFRGLVGVTNNTSKEVDAAVVRVEAAQVEAEQAAIDAAQAKQDALDAHNEAMTGIADAGVAQQAADDAVQAAAGAAQTAGEAAQTAADAASDVLILAGKTGRTIRSTTAPTGDDRNSNNLWLDTSTGTFHEWDGSVWLPITDDRLIAAANAAAQAANLAGLARYAADTADAKAVAAQLQADTAVGDAATAQAAATGAQGTADGAAGAALLAQQTAGLAQSSANSAAQAASDAAGLAAGKADVLIQSTAPSAAMRKITTLWIDTTGGKNTPKRWTSGTTWVEVTDKAAKDAAQAAVAAQNTANQGVADALAAHQAANEAQAAASGAQSTADAANATATTADGRYTVSGRNPTVLDGAGKQADSVWEVRNGSTSSRRFVWSGSGQTWDQIKAGQDFIGNKAIGRAQIGDAAVGTLQVGDATITNAKIGSITVDKLTVTGGAKFPTAVIQTLLAQDVFADNLYVTGAIVVGGPNKVDGATMIKPKSISTPELNVNALNFMKATGLELTAGKITGTEIIGVDIVGTSSVTGAEIIGGNITGTNITGVDIVGTSTITGAEISGGRISQGNGQSGFSIFSIADEAYFTAHQWGNPSLEIVSGNQIAPYMVFHKPSTMAGGETPLIRFSAGNGIQFYDTWGQDPISLRRDGDGGIILGGAPLHSGNPKIATGTLTRITLATSAGGVALNTNTIYHGLGRTPATVHVSSDGTSIYSIYLRYRVTNITSTKFDLKVYAVGGNVSAIGGLEIMWMATS